MVQKVQPRAGDGNQGVSTRSVCAKPWHQFPYIYIHVLYTYLTFTYIYISMHIYFLVYQNEKFRLLFIKAIQWK